MTDQPSAPTANTPAVYQPSPMLEADARMWAMLINLAAIIGAVLSGGTLSLVAVLVIWLVYRERSALVDFHGKQQLNLAITVVIASIVFVLAGVVTFMVAWVLLALPMIAYLIYVTVISIVAAVAANKGEYYRMPLVIRIIK